MQRGHTSRIVITAGVMCVTALLVVAAFAQQHHTSPHAVANDFVLDSGAAAISLRQIDVHAARESTPALHEPNFKALTEASVRDSDTGILIAHAGEQRFYPHTILAWHEVVNDSFGNDAVAVVFCPRTETGTAFHRQTGEETLRFGVSGLQYDGMSLLYDYGTETLWLGTRGLGAVGELSGTQLQEMKTQTLDAGTVRERYPLATTLTTDTGFDRNYQINPFKE